MFQLWLPDVEVLNLKMFLSLNVLSKLQASYSLQRDRTKASFVCLSLFLLLFPSFLFIHSQGLWVSQHSNLLYVLATRVTFICAMSFDAFPLDVQSCLLQVGSFNFDNRKMVFDRYMPTY